MEYEWVVFYFYAPSPNTSQFATRSVNVSHLCPHFLTIVRKWGQVSNLLSSNYKPSLKLQVDMINP